MRATWIGCVLALCAGLLGGCGYATGFTLPEGRKTVGVEFFGNQSPYPDLEAEFHGYLTEAVERLVDARLVSPDKADYVIRGDVTAFSRRRGIRSPDNVLLETGVRVGLRAELLERGATRRQPLESLRQQRFGSESGYRLEEPRGEADALDRVLRNLADEIVIEFFGFLAARETP